MRSNRKLFLNVSVCALGAASIALVGGNSAQAQVFTPVGPTPSTGGQTQSLDNPPTGTTSGAISDFILDPALGSNTMFASATNGGIFRSVNGGQSWLALTDKQVSLSIASLGLDVTDRTGRTLIAGTGLVDNGIYDAFNRPNREGSGTLRTGLLYSANGGETWSSLGTSQLAGQSVVGVAARGNIILAATFEPNAIEKNSTGGRPYGLYRSDTAGRSFQLVSGAGTLPEGAVSALAPDPSNPNVFYAAVTVSTSGSYQNSGVYKSVNAGETWTPVFTKDTPVPGGANVIKDAESQVFLRLSAGPNGSLAIAVAQNRKLGALYLQQSGAADWTQLTTPNVNPGRQANTNLTLQIDPNNNSIVYVAGDAVAEYSEDQPYTVTAYRVQGATATPIVGRDFTANKSTVHADARNFFMGPSGSLYLVTDGGIYLRSNPQDNTGAWTGLNGTGLQSGQPYNVAYGANAGLFVMAGQDNGASLQTLPHSLDYTTVNSGDGVNSVVSDASFKGYSTYYTSSQNLGGLNRIITNGIDQSWTADVVCDGNYCENHASENFGAPFVLNRRNPKHIALGGSSAYVAEDTSAATDPVVNLHLTDLGFAGGAITSIAYGTSDNLNAFLAGASGNKAYGSGTAGTLALSTTGAADSLSPLMTYQGAIPTSIVFDQRSQNRFYVVDTYKLWGTQNQGATIDDLSADLPTSISRPTAVEFINNNNVNALLVGGLTSTPTASSQIAVADSTTHGDLLGWRLFGEGLPNTLVNFLSYNSFADALTVSAVGRGIWSVYDVTSNFSQASSLNFGLANNDSTPSSAQLTDGTDIDTGTTFSRALNKYGMGTLTIRGASSYTGGTNIFNGVLQLGNGGANGSILGNVTFCSGDAPGASQQMRCNATVGKYLVFNRADSYVVDGSITGPGSLVQAGTGTTILTGRSNYTGPTTVSQGTLAINGSIASRVQIDPDGALKGSGSFGGGAIFGMLAPGNSIGAITSNGDLTFGPRSIYAVEINAAGASDKTLVKGATRIDGGTVAISGNTPSPHVLPRTRYTILASTNGVSGKFDNLIGLPTFSFLSPTLSYGANDVSLGFALTPFSTVAKNLNQRSVGNALTVAALGPVNSLGAPILNALFLGAYQNAQAVMDTVSGSGLAGVQSTAMQVGEMASSSISDQIAFWRSGETQDATGVTSQEGNTPRGYMSYAAAEKSVASQSPIQVKNDGKLTAAVSPRTFRAWGSMFGGGANYLSDIGRGSAASNLGYYGGLIGVDYQIQRNLLAGVAVGGSTANFNVGSLSTNGNLTGFHAGVYGAYNVGNSYIALNETFSAYNNQTSRKAGGYASMPYEQLNAGFGSTEFRTRLEVGHSLLMGGLKATPFVAAEYAAYRSSAFNEWNSLTPVSTFALGNNGQAIGSLPTFVGLRLSNGYMLANGWRLAPTGSVAYIHEFFPQRQFTNILLSMPGTDFNVSGPRSTYNLVQTKLGAQLNLTNRLALFTDFQGEFSSMSQSYGGKAGVRYTW